MNESLSLTPVAVDRCNPEPTALCAVPLPEPVHIEERAAPDRPTTIAEIVVLWPGAALRSISSHGNSGRATALTWRLSTALIRLRAWHRILQTRSAASGNWRPQCASEPAPTSSTSWTHWISLVAGVMPLGSSCEPDGQLGEDLLAFWNEHGFRIARALHGDPILIDVLRRHLPLYPGPPRTLYRGELKERHQQGMYGIAWTSQLHAAEAFAVRRTRDEGLGVVLKIDATPRMIVAGPTEHSFYLEEGEYVVDTRLIREVKAISTGLVSG